MDEASIRRFAALLLAPLFAVINKKWGLDLSEPIVGAVVALCAGYIALSNWKAASVAKSEASAVTISPAPAAAPPPTAQVRP